MMSKSKITPNSKDCLHFIHSQGEIPLKFSLCSSLQGDIKTRGRCEWQQSFPSHTLEALYSRGFVSLEFPDKYSWRNAVVSITEKGLEALNNG